MKKNGFLRLFKECNPKDKSIPKVLEAFEKGDISRKMAKEMYGKYGIQPTKEVKAEKPKGMIP